MDHDICLAVVSRGYWAATSTLSASQILAEAGLQVCDPSITQMEQSLILWNGVEKKILSDGLVIRRERKVNSLLAIRIFKLNYIQYYSTLFGYENMLNYLY